MARSLTGTVVSDKPDKTIVVSVQTTKTHPIYRKRYTVNTKFMAHDEKNEAKQGDKVVVRETRPISARKRYVLESIVDKAVIRHQEPEVEPIKKPKKEKVVDVEDVVPSDEITGAKPKTVKKTVTKKLAKEEKE